MIIQFKKIPMFLDPIWEARHKSCIAHITQISPKIPEMNIQMIQSKEENKGHASEMIQELKKWAKTKNFELVSSTPISPAWEHLCRKHQLKTYTLDNL